MALNNTAEFWSPKIVEYCGEHRLTLRGFSRIAGLHENTIQHIVNQKTKSIAPQTLGVLWKIIIKNQ